MSGQAVDISIQARELIRIKKLIVSYFARHTGKCPETVEKDLERDYYMSAEEAVEYGLIDKILKPSSPEKPGAGTDGVHIASWSSGWLNRPKGPGQSHLDASGAGLAVGPATE